MALSAGVPTDIDVHKCILISRDLTHSTDIRHLVTKFELFETLFSTNITATIHINDGFGLVERFPIVGGEYIRLVFSEATDQPIVSFERTVDLLFRINAIAGRQPLNLRSSTYVLTLITEDAMLGSHTEVNRSFQAMPAETAIETIFKSIFEPRRVGIKRPLDLDKTSNMISYVAGSIGPWWVIDDLAKEAVSLSGSSDMLFFEDHKGYHFKSLNAIKAVPPKIDYVFSEFHIDDQITRATNGGNNNINKVNDTVKIIGYSWAGSVDVLGQVNDGVAGTRVFAIDTITKRYTDTTYRFEKSGLGKSSPVSLTNVGDNVNKKMLISHISGGGQYSSQPYIVDKVVTVNNKTSDWQLAYPRQRHIGVGPATVSKAALATVSIDITVPGNVDRVPGEVVNLLIPMHSSVEEHREMYNRLFGGMTEAKFLVTGVKHTYDCINHTYVTVLNCSKDCYETTTNDEIFGLKGVTPQ